MVVVNHKIKNKTQQRRSDFFGTAFCFCLLILTVLWSCEQSPSLDEVKVTRGMYHWKTRLQLTKEEQLFLQKENVSQLYVRFFDVDKAEGTGEPIPVATTAIDSTGLSKVQVIPVVFITNRTLKDLSENAVDSLAVRIVRKINRQWNKVAEQEIDEIQLDCDWSGSTREAYFRLLQKIKNELHETTEISVTIRLHQVKYFQRTGIPPADRGMLMYYNMGEVSEWETQNSILDTSIASQYLYNFDRYPLSLDVALPIFSWGAIFRDERLVQLVHQLDENALLDTVRFERLASNRYRVKTGTYLDGFYCYPDDLIRLEDVSKEVLQAAHWQLQAHLPVKNRSVVLYHLDGEVETLSAW